MSSLRLHITYADHDLREQTVSAASIIRFKTGKCALTGVGDQSEHHTIVLEWDSIRAVEPRTQRKAIAPKKPSISQPF